jgi:hypothetical protein
MEATRSSETSVVTRATRFHVPEYGIHQRNDITQYQSHEISIHKSRITASWTLSIARNSENWNTAFRKLDLFPSSGEGRETPTLLGPLERANLKHWTTHVMLLATITGSTYLNATRISVKLKKKKNFKIVVYF